MVARHRVRAPPTEEADPDWALARAGVVAKARAEVAAKARAVQTPNHRPLVGDPGQALGRVAVLT